MIKFLKFLFMISLFAPVLNFGQNVKSEIIGINKKYYSTTHVAVNVISKVYKNNTSKPVNEMRLKVYKMPGYYLYDNGNSQSMANYKYKLNIDHKKKTIIVNEVIRKAPVLKEVDLTSITSQSFANKLDTIIENYKAVSVKKITDDKNEIVFFFNSGIYEFIKVVYNSKTYDVMEYILKTSSTTGTENFTYHIEQIPIEIKNLNKQVFSEANYIVVKNKKIVPAAKYADYKIINHSNKNS